MKRYAIYYAPRPGSLADRAAAWLGWDPVQGVQIARPALAGLPRPLAELTREPRKYGFHGTLKPPFRLVEGATFEGLNDAVAAFAEITGPITLDGLTITRIGQFLALVPSGDLRPLEDLAADAVRGLEALRAPLTAEEIARRSPDRLTERQRALLDRWGYPFVMDEFRFHLTLTGPLAGEEADAMRAVAEAHFADAIDGPFRIEDICLFGEAQDGWFHLIDRHALTG